MGEDQGAQQFWKSDTLKCCRVCGQFKSLHDFHWREDRKRHRYECRKCWNDHTGKRYRTEEYKVRKRERQREQRNNPMTQERDRRKVRKYDAKYPEKTKAKQMVRRAIVRGDLIRPSECQSCGGQYQTRDGRNGIQAHHPDYSKPLFVMWLCPICHAKEHSNAA